MGRLPLHVVFAGAPAAGSPPHSHPHCPAPAATLYLPGTTANLHPLPATKQLAVTQVAVAHSTEFFITASVDGHIKFWKKQPQGVEFAKHYKVLVLPVEWQQNSMQQQQVVPQQRSSAAVVDMQALEFHTAAPSSPPVCRRTWGRWLGWRSAETARCVPLSAQIRPPR